jgi:arylformamidase
MDYEAEYDNRARVPEHAAITEAWAEAARRYRAERLGEAYAELDIAYGPSERQRLDLFWPDAPEPAGLAVFVHGGYWQRNARDGFSHMARGANAHGIAVAVPGYDLCPAVTVSDIVNQIRACCRFLWQRFGKRLVVAGHSAGGHLAAAMVATNWPSLDATLPADLVPAGLAISGVFELEPLLHTSLNEALKLDHVAARAASPIDWPAAPGRTLLAYVGGAESREFLRQSREIAARWAARGLRAECIEIAGANHFTVLDPLADPDSAMTQALVALARAAGVETAAA